MMYTPLLKASRTLTEVPDPNLFNMHTHRNYEIYCFISGSAKYFVEGTVYHLRPRDILLIKQGEAHTLLIDDVRPYERIVISFDAEAIPVGVREKVTAFMDSRGLGENNCYSAAMFKDKHWQYYLNEICQAKDFSKKQAYLAVLLYELMEQYPNITSKDVYHDTTSELIHYINEHLCENITLEQLCDAFYISKPHINRKFKMVTGTTVWDYIKKKRLLKANALLRDGVRPTEVYLACGFNDYSTFYTAYRKEFCRSPKDDYIQNKEK